MDRINYFAMRSTYWLYCLSFSLTAAQSPPTRLPQQLAVKPELVLALPLRRAVLGFFAQRQVPWWFQAQASPRRPWASSPPSVPVPLGPVVLLT